MMGLKEHFSFTKECVHKDWCHIAFTEPSIQTTRKGKDSSVVRTLFRIDRNKIMGQ